jgi:hypothetical protein
MDQRIESFLTDVLALAGEEPDAIREGVRGNAARRAPEAGSQHHRPAGALSLSERRFVGGILPIRVTGTSELSSMSSYGQMPEKSAAWLEAECLERCLRLPPCRHLEAVKIEPMKPTGSGPNWQVAAFKPELHEGAHQEAMRTIDVIRGPGERSSSH